MKSPLQAVSVIVCGAVMILAAVSSGQQAPAARPEQAPVTIQPVTLGILLVKGGSGANSGLIIGNKEIIAVDAKMSPESVQEALAELRKTIAFPVTRIILTHSDADHVNGLPGFPKGLVIISHEQVKADLIKAAETQPALQDYLPTVTFKDEMKIKSGRAEIVLKYFGPAHTSGDIVVFINTDRTAYVGDLVFVGRDPLIHRSKNGSSSGLVKTLKGLLTHKPHIDTFIPGHGDILTRTEVENEIRDIEVKQSKIKTLVAEGKSLDEIKKIFQVEDRPGAAGRTRFMSLVEVIYLELTEKK
jgi:cyclase